MPPTTAITTTVPDTTAAEPVEGAALATPATTTAKVATEKNADGTEKKLAATPAQAAEAKKDPDPPDAAKPFRIVVDGKDQWYSQAEIVKIAQKGMGADKRFQEAHKIKTAAETFLWLLKNKPREILENPKLGIDFKKLAQEFIADEIKLEMMTPEQRELHEAKIRLAANEEEKKAATQKLQREQMEAAVRQQSENYERDITETLKTSGLPKTRETVRKIAYYLSEALKQNVVLKAADVIHLVKADYDQAIKDLFENVDGDALMSFLGDGNVKKLNEALLKKIKAGDVKPPSAQGDQPVRTGQRPKFLDKEEWRKEVDRRVASLQ